jgi:hypothetical protein
VLDVGRLGTRRRAKEGSSECGAKRRRWGCVLYGQGGGGEDGRWPAVVEFYSSSVSKELKGEVETGRRRFSGGSEGCMMALRFVSSHTEEGGSRQRTAWQCGGRGGGINGSRWWEPMEIGGGSRWKPEVGADGETKMGRVTKWAESHGGCSINSFSFF